MNITENDLIKLHEEATLKHAKLKLLYQLFTSKYLNESKLDKDLIKKAENIYLSAEATQWNNLSSNNKTNLLRDIRVPELTDIEKVNIKNDFLKTVDQNINELNKLYDYDVDPLKSIQLEKLAIVELEKKLEQSFLRYTNNLIEISNLLDKMMLLRTKNVKELCENKITQVKLESEKLNIKMKLITEEGKKLIVVNKKLFTVASKKVVDELDIKLKEMTEKLTDLELKSSNYKSSITKPEYKYVLDKFKKAKQELVLIKSLSDKLKTQHVY